MKVSYRVSISLLRKPRQEPEKRPSCLLELLNSTQQLPVQQHFNHQPCAAVLQSAGTLPIGQEQCFLHGLTHALGESTGVISWLLITAWGQYDAPLELNTLQDSSFSLVLIVMCTCCCGWGFASLNMKLCRDHRNQQEQRMQSFLKLNQNRLCVSKCFERCKWTPVVSSHIRWWNPLIEIHADM